jgi:hypothetical protein
VSWGTKIFALLVFGLAVAAVVYFLVVVLPARVATLARQESQELATARAAAATVNTSLTALWNDIDARGSMSLSPDRITQDLALARSTERAANDALGHVQAAQGYLAEADGIPFQFHHPAFIAQDQPALHHLEKSLQAATRLTHGATLQLAVAQHMTADWQSILNQLNPSLAAHNWPQVAATAGSLQTDLKSEVTAVQNPEALLDPLWSKWTDAMIGYATTAQSYSQAYASGQSQTAQQLGRTLAAESDQMGAAQAAAEAGAAAWQQKTIQPLLDTVGKELSAGS